MVLKGGLILAKSAKHLTFREMEIQLKVRKNLNLKIVDSAALGKIAPWWPKYHERMRCVAIKDSSIHLS